MTPPKSDDDASDPNTLENEHKKVHSPINHTAQSLNFLAYMSSYAIFGSSLRVYLSRIFGSDCSPTLSSYYHQEDSLHQKGLYLCITSSSNALFLDLPSNILGSFFMGIVSSPKFTVDTNQSVIISPLPWLQPHHSMQYKNHVHVALRSAFCGSLTTYSSWNTAMVVLIAGTFLGKETTATTTRGSGLVSALLGYFLGLTSCIMSFIMGRDVALFLHRRWTMSTTIVTLPKDETNQNTNNIGENSINETTTTPWDTSLSPSLDNNDVETSHGHERDDSDIHKNQCPVGKNDEHCTKNIVKNSLNPSPNTIPTGCLFLSQKKLINTLDGIVHWNYLPILSAILLLVLYIIGHVVYHQWFYKQMWISSLFSIPGALLRWKLGQWFNDNGSLRRRQRRWKWIPWGTFMANMVASVISIIITASIIRQSSKKMDSRFLILMSIKVGFAGSLSTVSTFVKEIVQLYDEFPTAAKSYYYSLGSLFLSCISCLAFYHIIII